MKIIIINGSHRKNGATGKILYEMYQQLCTYKDVDVEMIHLADLDLNFCVGCASCFKTGNCIYHDDIEELSEKIEQTDGIILGSPTYASNVSGQMKVLIDRGHFVMEQLLHHKYAISVATYENYGGTSCEKVLHKLLTYSGASSSGRIVSKSAFSTNPLENIRFRKKIQKTANRFYLDISRRRTYMLQNLKHFLVFQVGIKPFVLRKGSQYAGVAKQWNKKN